MQRCVCVCVCHDTEPSNLPVASKGRHSTPLLRGADDLCIKTLRFGQR